MLNPELIAVTTSVPNAAAHIGSISRALRPVQSLQITGIFLTGFIEQSNELAWG